MKATLHLTRDCNLRCRYCYASAPGGEAMSLDVGRKAIDLVVRLGTSSACVSYFGGEPLLQFDRIRELTGYARRAGDRLGKRMFFRMTTNGILFDEDKLAFCRDHALRFAISIDGDRTAHDTHRLTIAGAGSWRLIDEKLDLILGYNPGAVVVSVVTPETIEHLPRSLEYLWRRGVRFVAHQLDYSHPGWDSEVLARLETSYRQMALFYLERMRAGERFHLSLFDDKIRTHTRSPFALGVTCDFGRRRVSVAPDGRIFPCIQFVSDRRGASDYCIGHVDTGLTPRREELIAENRRERSACVGCALDGRCSNYCGCLNWQITGHVTEVPGTLCAHEQMLIPIADEIGNELFAEGNAAFLRKHYGELDELFPYRVD